ncbi:MAG: polysaccharide deacetylase family protein [Pseudomonadota bacterium]
MSAGKLEAELGKWSAAGTRPQLWWRDDDAVAVTPELERLAHITGNANVEVMLAVIPAHVDERLADYLAQHNHLKPCLHGWAHKNHAPAGEKKCELGHHRELDVVLGEIAAGRQRLSDLFGSDLMPVLVPPWNRMREDLATRLSEAGIKAFSTFAHKRSHPEIQVNTHVDVMNWKAAGGAAGKDLDQVLDELAAALGTSRANGGYPVGVLTHHLAHDHAAWSSLSGLLAYAELEWVPFEEALGDQPRTTS